MAKMQVGDEKANPILLLRVHPRNTKAMTQNRILLAGTEAESPESAYTGLLSFPLACSTNFLIQSGSTFLGMVLPTVGRALLH